MSDMEILIRFVLNLYIAIGRMVIFTILSLPTHLDASALDFPVSSPICPQAFKVFNVKGTHLYGWVHS